MAANWSRSKAEVAGRDVHLVVGSRTKTVNICTGTNESGVYEVTYRFAADAPVDLDDIEAMVDLPSLRAWLEEQQGDPEVPQGRSGSALPDLVGADEADGEWLALAVEATERALDRFVERFVDDPYVHRVEHSLHAELFALLAQEPRLSARPRLKDGRTTQLIHKEWPTTKGEVGPEGEPRPRGLFDLAVLSPQQVEKATVAQFRAGRIEAPIVIEVGLDYGLKHLRGDIRKVTTSEVRHPYLLHCTRLGVKDQREVEAHLCDTGKGYRAAYVHHAPGGVVRRKTVRADAAEQVRPVTPPASSAARP